VVKFEYIKQQRIIFSLFASVFFLSGCAHQNLVDAGQQFMNQQQFELAVDKFSAATKEEPDNQETAQQLILATDQLNAWANNLAQQAALAQQNQQLEKALLLYGKVFQITRSPAANSRYKALYLKLRAQSVLDVTLASKGIKIKPHQINEIDGLVLSTQRYARVLHFSQSTPVYEIEQSSTTLQTKYISGSETIINPELIKIQRSIAHNADQEHDNSNKINYLSRKLSQLQHKKHQLQLKTNSLMAQLSASGLTASKKLQLEQHLATTNYSLAQTSNQMQDRQHSLNVLRKLDRRQLNETNALAHDLAHLSPTVQIPIYSDYQYQVQHQTNSLAATVYLTVNKQVRPSNIRVESSDQSHLAHPLIELAADPMILSNKQQLTVVLKQQQAHAVKRLLVELVSERKANFSREAQQAIASDKKLALLIKHGLVTRAGATNDVSEQIKQMLILEYGRGGEFTVNQLLHLY